MEKTNLQYSTKNIPIATNREYTLKLIEKIEAVIKRMRWKAIFFDSENEQENEVTENYGLKTTITPQQVPELMNFEKELISIVRKLKFRKFTNQFQSKLKEDITTINASDKIYVNADKTSNIYKLSNEQYKTILNNSITSTYKKTNEQTKNNINKTGKEILKEHPILNRMNINTESNCFITLKDHKENFKNNPTTRLINPAKNELGRISKVILESINNQVRNALNLNQWKSTQSVIDWFNNIKDKQKHRFMVFDVKDFYPSITEELLSKAIYFANRIINISAKDKEIIHHARKSLLFNNKETWVKKGDKLFDVTMGAYDGAEVCELVGCFMLSVIASKYDKNDIGIYRDDGLAVFKDKSGPQSEKIKKDFQRTFKNHQLDIVIQCNRTSVDYLDVTLNLMDGTYRPFHKPNNETNYVHVQSNHPPNILKQIPLSIQTRLSNLSSNEELFHQATPHYQAALKRSGYNHTFVYKPTQTPNNRPKNRKRKIIWFNPPFNSNLSTNIGKFFLNLIKKHFPREHKYHKIFNKNSVKVSYSCMPNIKSKINQHNKQITTINPDIPQQSTCNCINKESCPLNQNCLSTNLVYEATIKSSQPDKKYIGLCETTFKKRFNNHKLSFNNEKYKNSTTLSIEYWKLKENNKNPTVQWRIVRQKKSYTPEMNYCPLCLQEKYEIATHNGRNLINKRTEIIAKCRHRRKFLLDFVK